MLKPRFWVQMNLFKTTKTLLTSSYLGKSVVYSQLSWKEMERKSSRNALRGICFCLNSVVLSTRYSTHMWSLVCDDNEWFSWITFNVISKVVWIERFYKLLEVKIVLNETNHVHKKLYTRVKCTGF